jgi:RNA-splicing ligase RtcB
MKIQIPKEISSEQEKLIREFDEAEVSAGKGFTGRITEAFEKFFGGNKDKKEEDEDSKKVEDEDSKKEEEKDRMEKLFGKKKKQNEKGKHDGNDGDGNDDDSDSNSNNKKESAQ